MNLITVVAGFVAGLTRTEVDAAHAITTNRRRAIITAGVAVLLITIITLLDTCLHKAVAAGGGHAGVETGIGIISVAIVADFFAVVHFAITAACHSAIIEAAVDLNLVAVIASLIARLFRAEINASQTIAA